MTTQPPALTAMAACTPSEALGQALRIRCMVEVAGEVLPLVWPMRNFIYVNPLHGLEHLPFEAAVAEAAALFGARGSLSREQYQGLLRDGQIDPTVLEELVQEFLLDWAPAQTPVDDGGDVPDLRRVLLTLITDMTQPAAGNAFPGTDAIMAELRPSAEKP